LKHCLVVDDSRVIRKVACRILEQLKFVAEEAEDAASALSSCRKSMPDAIILDADLGNAASFEFLRVLRREKNGNRPVVVVCTAENNVERIGEALGAGANDYLLKPFDQDILRDKLTQVGLL
jgi:two-component system, chemotaxis family, chemotaxis protein CheY